EARAGDGARGEAAHRRRLSVRPRLAAVRALGRGGSTVPLMRRHNFARARHNFALSCVRLPDREDSEIFRRRLVSRERAAAMAPKMAITHNTRASAKPHIAGELHRMQNNIALVDDDRHILTSISIALEAEGFKVRSYADGSEALRGLTVQPADLVVLDIKMPRMDGMELLRRLREDSNVPVIFLTSKDDEVDELLGLRMGA